MKKIKKWIVKLNIINIFSIFYYIFRIFPIRHNKIFCQNFTSGKGLGDSPKYIVSYLLDNSEQKYDIVWAVRKVDYTDVPKGIRLVKIYSLKYFYEMTTARIWISNTRFALFTRKRKEQYYIQTWHGGLALKKIEYDAVDKLSEYYKKVMKNDNELVDLMISNSKFCTNMYKNGFQYKGEIIEIGTPRNDILINQKEQMYSTFRNKICLNQSTKILLYAPTFRIDYSNNPYNINFQKLKERLESETNEKWQIIIRLHPRITNSKKLINFDNNIIDATTYADVQELICACDLLITDYSSTMFEALIADKNVIIYANDIERYVDERGFYFRFDELPFPIATNNEELIDIIKKYKSEDFKSQYKIFKEKVGLNENGNACEKICQIIESKILC